MFLLMDGYKKDSTNAFLAYFLHNQVVLCEEVLRNVCTPINNGGGKKSPLLSCIEANPFLLDVFMDYRNQKKNAQFRADLENSSLALKFFGGSITPFFLDSTLFLVITFC